MERKDFLKKLCMSGACLCGFGSSSLFATTDDPPAVDVNKQLTQDWLSGLLDNLEKDVDADTLRKIIKKSAIVHFNQLKMGDMLSEYIGDMDKFISFLETKWGWKVNYDKLNKVLIADENKNVCVCPVLDAKKEVKSAVICYCSEGFAEKMFSTVAGVPVTAKVISSVRRGDKTCKYKVQLQ